MALNPGVLPKFHFGTPSDCQLKNEGCQRKLNNSALAGMQAGQREKHPPESPFKGGLSLNLMAVCNDRNKDHSINVPKQKQMLMKNCSGLLHCSR
ncbi:MAG: hypothetical protein GY795_43770 [Desulfobacterales bacterium]|nr:hypothetical protein [Desulfobacterales bacterium]